MPGQEGKTATGAALHELFREVFGLHSALCRVMDRIHDQAGLSTPDTKLMTVLDRRGEATVPEAAMDMDVSRQYVQKVANNLEKREFLEFVENPRHKTSRLMRATGAGREAHARAKAREESIILDALGHVDAGNVGRAVSLLAQLRLSVERSDPED